MAQTNKADPKEGEIHVLSLDGGGSRGIMESIMLGHVMDVSTLMTVKPSKITKILRNFQLDGPEVGKKFQSLIELERLSPIHPTEAFQYIVGKYTLSKMLPMAIPVAEFQVRDAKLGGVPEKRLNLQYFQPYIVQVWKYYRFEIRQSTI